MGSLAGAKRGKYFSKAKRLGVNADSICKWIAAGFTWSEIAKRLGVARNTLLAARRNDERLKKAEAEGLLCREALWGSADSAAKKC